jgi:selenocysteine lyase/cysteine desulfurase
MIFEEDFRVSRRALFRASGQVAGAAGLTLGAVKDGFSQSVRALAELPSAWRTDEGYWAKIRAQFLLEDGLAYLNNGTVGPTPGPVYEAMVGYWRLMAENPNENSAILQGRTDLIREKAAQFVGASAGEIAIVRNATEGNNLVCQGLDLKEGDEVLIGYLEHASCRQPWRLKAKRYGIVLKEVPIGTPPKSPEEIVNAFEAAITPRTRVISVSHCDTVTGTYAPVREIAKLAHSRDILCFSDGAQALGMIEVNVRDLGVDAYIMTGHKWLCSPAGTGLLYVRRDVQNRIWPNIVTENWSVYDDARKYDRISRRPWPVVAALEDALDFQLAVGRARIEQRMRALASYLRSKAAEIPHVKLYTSNDPRLSGAMTSLAMDNVAPERLREYLRQRYDIYTAPRSVGERYPADPHGVPGIRVSTHYYNTFEQVERVLSALKDLASARA